MEIRSLGIVTAVTAPSTGFGMTRQSVKQLHELGLSITWHIIVGQLDDQLRVELDIAETDVGSILQIQSDEGNGVYSATNQGLSQVKNEYFVILHSGDILYPSLLEQLPKLDDEFVHSFSTDWHTVTGAKVTRKAGNSIHPWLARMPHHQTMIFPRRFANRQYHLRFPISADQDLKLEIWRSRRLVVHQETIGSSLVGGLTTRRLRPREISARYIETRNVLLLHFPRAWAEIVAVGYGLRYALNGLGVTSFHSPREDLSCKRE